MLFDKSTFHNENKVLKCLADFACTDDNLLDVIVELDNPGATRCFANLIFLVLLRGIIILTKEKKKITKYI